MPVCAISGPSGLELHQLASAADACSGVVLLQAADVPPNPFVLTVADGLLVSGAVGTVWGLAWSLRAIRSVLQDKD
jgi:hypothetical protein